MAVTSGSGTSRELDQTPTWAVAGVCLVIIIISIALEKSLHKVGMWFTKRHKKALFEALEKVKEELMILGFISLLLTFSQYYIAKICIPSKVADTMLPCPWRNKVSTTGRRLLWFDHRVLAAGDYSSACKAGKVPIITVNGLHQLHILIFFLAVFHVVYSAVTMALGRLKIRRWKQWEQETSSHDYEFSVDHSRFRLAHETSFVRAHTSFWTKTPVFFYIGCFFRQFFRSVNMSDYLTLRNGFIKVHLAPGSNFNFQKYIKRSLEDDFKTVVGVSPVLWASFVIFLLLNVYGWQALFWASLIPLLIILAVGTKLQAILTRMALEITERHAVVQGIPLVQGSDKYFWFGRPQLVLNLIHFALFQYQKIKEISDLMTRILATEELAAVNIRFFGSKISARIRVVYLKEVDLLASVMNAFQITYFFWIWYSFGLNSCFHNNFKLVIVKVALGVGVLVLCSYITLPLYALIAQMGSHMKITIFDDQTSKALKNWQMAAKRRQHEKGGKSSSHHTLGGGSPASSVSPRSPFAGGPMFQWNKTTSHTTRSFSYENHEASDFEADTSPMKTNLIVKIDHDKPEIELGTALPHPLGEGRDEGDFSFAKNIPSK